MDRYTDLRFAIEIPHQYPATVAPYLDGAEEIIGEAADKCGSAGDWYVTDASGLDEDSPAALREACAKWPRGVLVLVRNGKAEYRDAAADNHAEILDLAEYILGHDLHGYRVVDWHGLRDLAEHYRSHQDIAVRCAAKRRLVEFREDACECAECQAWLAAHAPKIENDDEVTP